MESTLPFQSELKSAVLAEPPRLRPHLDPTVAAFIEQQDHAHRLVEAFGSPLNVVFPDIIARNIERFEGVYKKYHLEGQIFYTTKPNKSHAIKRRASLENVWADVSSEQALIKVLAAGFSPSRIETTGPKSFEYLSLSLQQGVIVNADNFEELRTIIDLRRALGLVQPTRIFVRLCGFHSTRMSFTKQDGTFGIHVDCLNEIISFIKQNDSHFDFIGFSYYVSDASIEQRVVIIEQALMCTFEALRQGLMPRGLNIGGGFRIQYAESAEEWARYTDAIKRSVIDRSFQLTWNDGGLGYRNEKGLVVGAPNYMDHYSGVFGEKDLERTLTAPLPEFNGETAASIMAEVPLQLFIEPGRALLDQTGISIGRVTHTKKSVQGETLVVLDMNRSNLHATHQKLLTEPFVLYRGERERQVCPEGVYYVGNVCVSYDIIQYNKTFPKYLPQAGDLVAFANTGSYMMDFIESGTLHQNIARKVAATLHEGEFSFADDEKYHPLSRQILNGELHDRR
jgi:diaminopimelate decarboxylase